MIDSDILREPADLTPDRLDSLLKKAAALTTGRVTEIQVGEAIAGQGGQRYQLLVNYAPGSSVSAPRHLSLKIGEPGLVYQTHEVVYYSQIVPKMRASLPKLPLIPCYHAAYDSGRQQSSFLFADTSKSHRRASDNFPPTVLQSEQMIDALALIHAYWWQHPWLGVELGEAWTHRRLENLIARAQRNLAGFLSFSADRLSTERGRVLQAICSRWPARRRSRLLQRQGITLVHRHAHPQSFLCPLDPEADQVLLTDWHSWTVDSATDDLAYLMAAHWYAERRGRFERLLLKRYYRQLVGAGVQDYAWEDCCYDYQASIIRVIFTLVGGWRRRRNPSLYWDRLEKSLIAFEDWSCEELLD